jgi:hypothetical protein
MQKLGASMYHPLADAPDFCKLIAFDSQRGESKLEQIAKVIAEENYDRKVDKFQQKCDKMKHKLMNARKAAKPSAPTTAAGGIAGLTSVTSISDIINKAEQMKQEECTDSRVAKAQGKLDSYLEKNKTLHESTKYTTAGKSVGGLISWGAGMEGNERNINEDIEAEREATEKFADTSMKALTEFLGELLELATKVGVMAIMDGNKTSVANAKHDVRLDFLTSKQLMNAQSREMFYITK